MSQLINSIRNDELKLSAHRFSKDVVTVSPLIMSGAPVFTDTRVPIKNLFDYLSEGLSLDEFFVSFPNVKREQVLRLLREIGESFDID